MISFEEYKKLVYAKLKKSYVNFREDSDDVKRFLFAEEDTLKKWYDIALNNGRLASHLDIEVNNSAWGLDLVF